MLSEFDQRLLHKHAIEVDRRLHRQACEGEDPMLLKRLRTVVMERNDARKRLKVWRAVACGLLITMVILWVER